MLSGVRWDEVGDSNELRRYNKGNNESPRILHLKDIKVSDKGVEKIRNV